MEIERISIAVEIEGKPHLVVLPQESMHIVLMAAQGLSENGKLNVVEAPEGLKMLPLQDLKS